MNYDKVTPIKVAVEGGLNPERKLELTMSPFADLDDWIQTFKTILIQQTFAEDTIKELFQEEEYINTNDEFDSVDVNIDCQSPRSAWKDEF